MSWKAKSSPLSLIHLLSRVSGLAVTTSEIIWLQQSLQDFQITNFPALLYCDNQAAIHIPFNPIFHERTEIECHFTRDKVTEGSIKFMPVRSQHQLADAFTRPLPSTLLFPLLSNIAVKDTHSPP